MACYRRKWGRSLKLLHVQSVWRRAQIAVSQASRRLVPQFHPRLVGKGLEPVLGFMAAQQPTRIMARFFWRRHSKTERRLFPGRHAATTGVPSAGSALLQKGLGR